MPMPPKEILNRSLSKWVVRVVMAKEVRWMEARRLVDKPTNKLDKSLGQLTSITKERLNRPNKKSPKRKRC